MCGICGFVGKGVGANDGSGDLRLLKAMCDIMAHRGPDGEGQYVDDGVALGHRRLSLIDLEGGNQPLVRATGERVACVSSPARALDGSYVQGEAAALRRGDYVIVFNGEIYNYRDLRAELESAGWEFATHSDTEVLLVGYLAWGQGVLDRLRGMFAFAIWNKSSQELFLARDFFGIKPLYYTVQDGTFIFASEIKSILEHPAYERALNHEALEQYLCFQFSALDETFFKGVFKLPPAHCAVVRQDGSFELTRYWRPAYCRNNARTYDQTVEAIREVMQDSVRYHNVADVEVGSFLSSGIDSSYLAACLAQENPDIKTFTVGFAEYVGERDEVSWAQDLSVELGVANTSHHISEEEYWESLARVQWHMDEPCADPSAIALYFVDKLASTQVKAVLSGEGADEFFAGYKIYQAPLASKKAGWAPKPLLRFASKALGAFGIRGANYLARASQTVEDWYYTNANGVVFTTQERARLLRRPVAGPTPQALTASVYAEVSDEDQIQRMQYVDLYFWLVGDILLKTDKMSMAHSLESRVPFLDKRVFELSATIPTSMKVDERQTKRPLRSASENRIPQDWAQKEKLGFPVPIVNWLREDRYAKQVREAFEGAVAQEFFDTNMLVSLMNEHLAGKDNSRKIWLIYMFLTWYGVYFEGQG